jgi:hypothetical protein
LVLTERFRADQAKGDVLSGNVDRAQMLALRPQMIDVNSLIDGIRTMAKKNYDESGEALRQLQEVLRDKLGLAYKLESKVKPQSSPTKGADA